MPDKEYWRTCTLFKDAPLKPAKDMEPLKIRDELYDLLFKGIRDATDPELLSIQIRRDKANHFDFLKAKTEWPTVGFWEPDKYPPEPNYQIDVQYWDVRPNHPEEDCREAVGHRLIELLEAYNSKVIGEKQLYARTTPIEESTL